MRPCLFIPSPWTVIHSSTFLTLALENVAKNPTHQSRPPCPTSPSASSAAVCQANITFVRRTCITVTSICEAVTRSVIWQPRFWPIGRLVSVLLMFAAVNDAALLCGSYARETIRQKCLFVLNKKKKKKSPTTLTRDCDFTALLQVRLSTRPLLRSKGCLVFCQILCKS